MIKKDVVSETSETAEMVETEETAEVTELGQSEETAVVTEPVEVEETAETMESMETKTEEETTEPVEAKKIYIGPTLKGVVHGSVFKTELPPMLQEAIAASPAIGELVIPVSNVVTANKELANPKSALSRFYDMAQRYSKGDKRS